MKYSLFSLNGYIYLKFQRTIHLDLAMLCLLTYLLTYLLIYLFTYLLTYLLTDIKQDEKICLLSLKKCKFKVIKVYVNKNLSANRIKNISLCFIMMRFVSLYLKFCFFTISCQVRKTVRRGI